MTTVGILFYLTGFDLEIHTMKMQTQTLFFSVTGSDYFCKTITFQSLVN